MKIEKQLVSIQIENPHYIGGEIWLDDTKVCYLEGLSRVKISQVTSGVHTLSFYTRDGIIKNDLVAMEGGTHTLHLSHTFHESELRLRFKEAVDLIKMGGEASYRFKELASIKELITRRDVETGKTLLHIAADHLFYEGSKILLECGSTPDNKDRFGVTPLMSAAEKSNIDLIKLLIKNGADIYTTDIFNENALMKGIQVHKNARIITNILLEYKIPCEERSRKNNLTPLLKTLQRKEYAHLTDLLMEYGCNPYIEDQRGFSSFDIALEGKNLKAIKHLMKLEVSPKNPMGIFKAIDTENREVLIYHLSFFKDVDIFGEHGITPLMYCSVLGYKEGTKLLLKNFSELERRDFQGETALFYSLYHPEITALLIEAGADKNALNYRGESPLVKLIPEKFRDTARLLF